ncbi:MAG: aminotransferase class V-fold PLP-dependent enzyme [Acetobacteraceae bacterium]|nr:aminotransferase class V-fold PLP-dependent enzyme [Acetobacteraceae bacterium]
MIYLDANASEPLRPDALAAVHSALMQTGNPSSVHQAGRAARRILEEAREQLAFRFSARPGNLVFTSGATEANALAVHGLRASRRLLIGATEHDSIRASGSEAEIIPVDDTGVVALDSLEAMLGSGPPALVCLMLANNETGVMHPVREVAALCRSHGALLHVDAVQAAGRVPLDLSELGADSLAISSHKLGGPAGAGALLLAPAHADICPLIAGGGQERGRRGGTPAVAAIAGFAAAALAASGGEHLAPLRDSAERAAVARGAVVCGAAAPRLPNTSCVALPGVRADAQVIALDLARIAVSAGAACSSGKVGASHVLRAMGLGPLAGQAIRISLPWNADPAHVDAFGRTYAAMAERLHAALPHDGSREAIMR